MQIFVAAWSENFQDSLIHTKFWKREKHLLMCFSRNEANLSRGQEANLCTRGVRFIVSDNTRDWGWRGADIIHFLVMKCWNLRSPQQACRVVLWISRKAFPQPYQHGISTRCIRLNISYSHGNRRRIFVWDKEVGLQTKTCYQNSDSTAEFTCM